jgi:hypothetical protein
MKSDKERIAKLEKAMDAMVKAVVGLGEGFTIHNNILEAITDAMAYTEQEGPLN